MIFVRLMLPMNVSSMKRPIVMVHRAAAWAPLKNGTPAGQKHAWQQ